MKWKAASLKFIERSVNEAPSSSSAPAPSEPGLRRSSVWLIENLTIIVRANIGVYPCNNVSS